MTVVEVAACTVGRLGDGGPWVGFAPTLDDGYALVVARPDGSARTAPAEADDLVALAVAYFLDDLAEPPEELAATHGDIGALVRHRAELEADPARRRRLGEAVDAVDDGLAADVVVGRLSLCLEGDEEPVARLVRRSAELLAG
jgi:hypothetical protein